MTPPPLNASLGAMSAAVSGGATKSGGGLGSPTGVVTTNAGLTTARGGHGHDHHHHHHHHHNNNKNQHQHQHRQHHHASVSGGVVSAAYQGSLSSRGAAGHGGVAPGGHHLHGPAPTPARFFLAHHSIIVPKAASWGHAALRDASTRGAIGVTSVSVAASASSPRAAAAAAAASATSQSIHRRHPLRRPQHPPRAAVVAAGTTSSSPSAPTSSFDDDDERGRRRGAKGVGGEHDEGEVQENKAAGARGDSAAAAAAADDFDSDKDDCEAPHYENCPVSPAFNDARIPSWMSVTRAKWDGVTARLASSATVPFLFLTVPQIAKNASLIAAGRPEALAAISWQGHVAGLLGNLLLLSYFADKGETSASVVQAAGVCATGALLFQMCLAGHIPVAAFAAAAVAVAAGVMLSGMRIALNRAGAAAAAADDDVAAAASSRSGEKRALDVDGVPCVGNVQCDVGWDDDDDDDDEEDENEGGGASERRRRGSRGRRHDDRAWEAYQGLLGVVGSAALPQVGLASLLSPQVTASLGVVPGVAGAALGLALVVMGRAGALPPALASAWGKLSGWTATLLFMTMPVAQLASNFARPASLEGLSILSSVLAMTGNALMVPRALYTRDVIWLTGSTWGSLLMGWGVMLSLFLGRRAADGARYVGSPAFFGLSVFFFGYLLAVLVVDGVASLAAGRHAGWRLAAWRFQGLSADDGNKKKKK